MSNNEEWSKIETSQPMIDWNNQQTVDGVLTEVKSDIGPNLSHVYVIQKEDGSECGVWGSTTLDAKMCKIPVGAIVKIVYLGMKKTKDGKRTFKDFDVFTKPVAFSRVENEVAIEDIKI